MSVGSVTRGERLRGRRSARRRGLLAFLLVGAGAATTAYPALAYGTGAIRQNRLQAEVRTLLGPEAPEQGFTANRAPAPGAGATEPIQVSVAGEAPRQVDGGRDGGAGKARAVAQKPRPPADGQPLGILEVPSVGISAVILEGIAGQTLLTGPGHLPWTALPGSNDVSVVAGHRDIHFRNLKDVRTGTRVFLHLRGRTIEYRVSARDIVEPDAAWVTTPLHRPLLRLVTCWPPDYLGFAPERLVVTAIPVAPVADQRPAVVPLAGSDQPARPFEASFEPLPAEPLPISPTAGDILPPGSLPVVGAAGAALSVLATFGAWWTRRRLRLWLVPCIVGLALTAVVLVSAWGGPQILAAR